ncbi:MAG: FAD-binding oxidoreductase [bacterium]|nr:FAD-binding oxidoreductase [bacterium]
MLPSERLEWVEGWGMAVGGAGYVYRPTTIEALQEILALARRKSVPIALRGSGQSYGDAALRPESIVLDLSRMNRVLEWDPGKGVIDVEPGLTVSGLWRYALGDGWWPPVVTGTMQPSIGGCLGMNVHGKNNWQRGTLGEHCKEFDLLLANGEVRTVDRASESDLFHAVIGSFGQLGIVTRARLQLKRVHSGLVEVKAESVPNLKAMLEKVDQAKDEWEYVVGWIDGFAKGRKLGRGLLHYARHLELGEDPVPAQGFRAEIQDVPDTLFGVVPKTIMWRLIKPWSNRPGMRLINLAKFLMGSTLQEGACYRQSLAAFSFLLDYVPSWKRIYEPGGLIQHQSMVPYGAAEEVFSRQLELSQRAGSPSFLVVLKRHRPDDFLLSHAVDGYSMAMDFPVYASRKDRLWKLVRQLAEPVVAAGGRFYPAKDAAIPADLYRATFTHGELDRLCELKTTLDPDHLLRSAFADRMLWASDP